MMLAGWGEEGLREKLKYSALYVPPQAVVWGFHASCMGPAQKHHPKIITTLVQRSISGICEINTWVM